MTSKVLYQGPCDVCNSSDAGTHYADGGYHCFSCGHTIRKETTPWAKQSVKETVNDFVTLPDDASTEFSQEAITWLRKYDLTVVDVLQHGVKWSNKTQQLLFAYHRIDDPSKIGVIQARNFKPSSTKYYNKGDITNVLPIYCSKSDGDTLVLVEDALSAIKVVQFEDCMPLLGSSITLTKILQIKNRAYKQIIVWLDRDKYDNALKISQQFKMIGLKSSVICTDLDPKCYDYFCIEYKLDEKITGEITHA